MSRKLFGEAGLIDETAYEVAASKRISMYHENDSLDRPRNASN